MKKRVLSVGLTLALSMAAISGCGQKQNSPAAAETKVEETKTEDTKAEETKTEDTKAEEAKAGEEYRFVSPAEAVTAAKEGTAHVLDVREWDNYVKGRVSDSQWCPIFPLDNDELAASMAEYAKKNLSDGEKIYIICNSGQKGAQKATGVLKDAGIDGSLIYTVEGGAKALADEKGALTTNRAEENIEWKTIAAAEALKAVGSADVQILDVRDDSTYGDGHLKDSLQINLKEIEDADAQTAMYQMATEKMDKTKPVYLLCYSGNKCAKTGISILKDAGFDVNNLFIIENGAKDSDIQAAFVKE